MSGEQVTVYLRVDEVKAIEQYAEKHHVKRHQAIKRAIRSFFFSEDHSS